MADVIIPSTSTLGTQMLDWAYFQQASSFTGDTTVLPYSGANMRVHVDFAYTSEGVRSAPSPTTGDFAVTPGSNTTTTGTIQIAAGYGIVQGDSSIYQGKYIVVSYGAVDFISAILGMATGSIKYHLVVAEVIDRQSLNITTGQSQWQYRVIEDKIGYGSAANALTNLLPLAPNALPLAVVRRQINTMPVTQADITDFRPLCVAVGAQPNLIAMASWKTGGASPITNTSGADYSNMFISNVPCVIGRTYMIEAQFAWSITGSGNGNIPVFRIKEAASAVPGLQPQTAIIAGGNPPIYAGTIVVLAGSGSNTFIKGPYYCTSTGLKIFCFAVGTNYSGGSWSTMNVLRSDSNYMAVYDAGLSSVNQAY